MPYIRHPISLLVDVINTFSPTRDNRIPVLTTYPGKLSARFPADDVTFAKTGFQAICHLSRRIALARATPVPKPPNRKVRIRVGIVAFFETTIPLAWHASQPKCSVPTAVIFNGGSVYYLKYCKLERQIRHVYNTGGTFLCISLLQSKKIHRNACSCHSMSSEFSTNTEQVKFHSRRIMSTMAGNKRDPRPSAWRKPLFIVCVASLLAFPLSYFEGVLVSIFSVSKNEPQVRKDDLVLGCELRKQQWLCTNEMFLTFLNLYAFVSTDSQHCCYQNGKFEFRWKYDWILEFAY
jgi:hypothetical protein